MPSGAEEAGRTATADVQSSCFHLKKKIHHRNQMDHQMALVANEWMR
jgi:hypothetical protein